MLEGFLLEFPFHPLVMITGAEVSMPSVYRADHVGSLLRPAALLRARESGFGGEQLHKMEDEFILESIRRQKEIGLDVLTDGELRRRNFMSDFVDAVTGFDTGKAVSRSWSGQASGAVSRSCNYSFARERFSLRAANWDRFCDKVVWESNAPIHRETDFELGGRRLALADHPNARAKARRNAGRIRRAHRGRRD